MELQHLFPVPKFTWICSSTVPGNASPAGSLWKRTVWWACGHKRGEECAGQRWLNVLDTTSAVHEGPALSRKSSFNVAHLQRRNGSVLAFWSGVPQLIVAVSAPSLSHFEDHFKKNNTYVRFWSPSLPLSHYIASFFSWKSQWGFIFMDGKWKQPFLCFGCCAVPSRGGSGSWGARLGLVGGRWGLRGTSGHEFLSNRVRGQLQEGGCRRGGQVPEAHLCALCDGDVRILSFTSLAMDGVEIGVHQLHDLRQLG